MPDRDRPGVRAEKSGRGSGRGGRIAVFSGRTLMGHHQNRRPRAWLAALAAAVLSVALPLRGDDAPRKDREPVKPLPHGTVGRMEARLADGSILRVTLLDSRLRLKTEYGELNIPVDQIRRIDFAT